MPSGAQERLNGFDHTPPQGGSLPPDIHYRGDPSKYVRAVAGPDGNKKDPCKAKGTAEIILHSIVGVSGIRTPREDVCPIILPESDPEKPFESLQQALEPFGIVGEETSNVSFSEAHALFNQHSDACFVIGVTSPVNNEPDVPHFFVIQTWTEHFIDAVDGATNTHRREIREKSLNSIWHIGATEHPIYCFYRDPNRASILDHWIQNEREAYALAHPPEPEYVRPASADWPDDE